MNRHLIPIVITILLNVPLDAQNGLIFSGRIVDENTGRGISGLMVRLVGQGGDITDDEGMFRIAIRINTDQVQVELPAGWEIQYPRSGQAPVLRSADAHLDIEVKRLRSQNEQLLREIDRLRDEKRLKEAQIDSLQQVLEDSLGFYQKRFQLSVNEYQDAAQRAEAETRALREKISALTAGLEDRFTKKNKAEIRGRLTSELRAYLTRLKDVRNFLPDFRDIFLYENVAKNFDGAVQRYNEARAPVYDHQEQRLAQVDLYWKDEVLNDDLKEVYTLINEKIHAQLIHPMNNDLMTYRKEVATGRRPRISATRKARARADEVSQALAFPTEELEQKIREVNNNLAR